MDSRLSETSSLRGNCDIRRESDMGTNIKQKLQPQRIDFVKQHLTATWHTTAELRGNACHSPTMSQYHHVHVASLVAHGISRAGRPHGPRKDPHGWQDKSPADYSFQYNAAAHRQNVDPFIF